jgi:transposase InsO family protein
MLRDQLARQGIRANQVWALDTTYIPMARGFIYLTAVVGVPRAAFWRTRWRSRWKPWTPGK